MISVVLLGKGDIAEDMRWCKKYSGLPDEEERRQKGKLNLGLASEVMAMAADPALDTAEFGPKFKEIGTALPNSDDLSVLTEKIFKSIQLSVLFEKVERIPGKPDYEMAVGWSLDTFPIFYEEKVYRMADIVQTKKKMGLFSEKVTVKEKALMTFAEIFGKEYGTDDHTMTVLSKEKDNRDQLRFSLRLKYNMIGADPTKMYPEKFNHKYKDDAAFFAMLGSNCATIGGLVNQVYKVLGYDETPNFSIFLGKVTSGRKVSSLSKEGDPNAVIDVKYV